MLDQAAAAASVIAGRDDACLSPGNRFVHDEVVPHHDRWEEKGEVDRELWLKAGENGLLGINISDEIGGLGEFTTEFIKL